MKNVVRVIILVVIMLLCCIDVDAEEPKTNLQLVKETCENEYNNSKIKFIYGYSEKVENIILNRANQNYVVVEIIISKSCGNYGFTKEGYYITYNENVPVNEIVTSFCIYNPYTNYIDDVTFVVDNQKVR